MNGESVPSSTCPEPATTVSPVVLPLTTVDKKSGGPWTLTLHPPHLALADAPGSQPYVILREEMMKSATLIEGMRVFALTKPRKATFKLAPEGVTALAEWIGQPVLAAYYLRRRYGWVLPVAIIWVIGSLPLGGDTASGVAAVPFDPVGLGLGLTLIVSWAFAKWRPHPLLFLIDSLWFLCLAGYLVKDVIGGRSKGWLVLVALLVWMTITGLKHFARFRGTGIAPLRR